MPTLLAVPNVAEGRDAELIDDLAEAFAAAAEVRLLDRHSDADHNRSVFTLAGPPPSLVDALLAGARVASDRIDLTVGEAGVHPRVGALDVAPLVYLDRSARGVACAAALLLADRLGSELELPVFLYGALAGGRTRAELRRGGPEGLAARIAAAELAPDFGPARAHARAGATLVSAREPLVAFNVELAAPRANLEDARRVAALVREGGAEGLPGLRAIGVPLSGRQAVQISMNVEDPLELPLGAVVAAIARHVSLERAEIVGLVPRASLAGFPPELPIGGFDEGRQVIENVLGGLPSH
jgi:glutamate formiminotransferase